MTRSVILADAWIHFHRLTRLLACASMGFALASIAAAAELAPTGVLRATYNDLNPGDARFDHSTRQVVGPVVEVTKEFARRLDVAFEIIGMPGVPAVIDRVRTGHADIGFVPCDRSQLGDVDYTQPYALVRNFEQCIVVARGGESKVQFINRAIEELRKSGRLRDIVVAEPGKPPPPPPTRRWWPF